MNRVKIAEKEREGLEGEKIAAEAYLFKDAERLGSQSKIFQRFMHDGQVSQTFHSTACRVFCQGKLCVLVLHAVNGSRCMCQGWHAVVDGFLLTTLHYNSIGHQSHPSDRRCAEVALSEDCSAT